MGRPVQQQAHPQGLPDLPPAESEALHRAATHTAILAQPLNQASIKPGAVHIGKDEHEPPAGYRRILEEKLK